MSTFLSHKGWSILVALVLVLGLAALVGVGGCGEAEIALPPTQDGEYTSTTWGAAASTAAGAGGADQPEPYYYGVRDESSGSSSGVEYDTTAAGTLTALSAASGQKIISNATLEIEVESGKFQTVYDQALLLATHYGGYLVSSQSYASGEENSMKSGTVAIRVPAASFSQALSEAGKLGEVKSQEVGTQDVTEEYVDLQARIKNSQAHVNSLLTLLGQAKTVDEILQVQQVLIYAQQELEQLEGRQRYLDEHTSFSTITMSIYETGVEAHSSTEWGITRAFKDGLHNLVDAVNAIIRGLGVLIPVLVVLGIIAYAVYRIVRSISRRNRERAQARYQGYPQQGWAGQSAPQGTVEHADTVSQAGATLPPDKPAGSESGDAQGN